jgi:hypothetical protein
VCLRRQVIHAPFAITQMVSDLEVRHDAQRLRNGKAEGKPDDVLC